MRISLEWAMDPGGFSEAYLDTHFSHREPTVLTTVAIVLIVLWALGLLGGYSAGGLLHLLLVVAAVIVVLRLLSGRRAI